MPFLWAEVEMWPRRVYPYTLLRYPRTPLERVLKRIRKMTLSTGFEDKDMDITKCNKLAKYISKCFHVLVAAASLQHVILYIRLYDPDDYDPGLRPKFQIINSKVLRILRHVESLDLRELVLHPSRDTGGVKDMMRIIERKVNNLDINTVPLYSWVDRLPRYQQLNKIKVCRSRPFDFYSDDGEIYSERWALASAKFWSAISRLSKVDRVDVEGIPLSVALGLQFPHLVHLSLRISFLSTSDECASSFLAAFTQMPNLENLRLHSGSEDDYEQAINALKMTEIACQRLVLVSISPFLPQGFVSTIATHNPNLTSCYFTAENVDDQDIYHLSRCKHIRSLCLEHQTNVTHGLTYLTNLPKLDKLRLHYTIGKYIDTQLLLNMALSCPALQTIEVSDYIWIYRPSQPRPFEYQGLADLFSVDSNLHAYIDPHYNTGEHVTVPGLDKYIIRLDKLREDRVKDY